MSSALEVRCQATRHSRPGASEMIIGSCIEFTPWPDVVTSKRQGYSCTCSKCVTCLSIKYYIQCAITVIVGTCVAMLPALGRMFEGSCHDGSATTSCPTAQELMPTRCTLPLGRGRPGWPLI